MSEARDHGAILQRLRANLQAAGIPHTEADIEGMEESGFIASVLEFERLAATSATDEPPDYLAAWANSVASLDDATPPASPAPPESSPADLHHASITQVASHLRAGEVSPVELTRQCLERIGERDTELNAFQLVLADGALDAAREAEREIHEGRYRGPLHGVPVAIKDLLAMAGTPTTAGSRVYGDWVPDYDAAAVERLKAAGAVILGKTRLSELAYSPGSNNAHYGPTRNPWNPDYDAGGSSSGSGAAVATGMAYAALGSDTGGSIRIPSALCGIVGLKPTYGRVSLHGVVSLSWSLDHLGPMTRTVGDAALLLEALAGHDPRDPRTRPGTGYDAGLARLDAGVQGLLVGVLRDDGAGRELGRPEVLTAWRKGLAALEGAGARLVEVEMPRIEDMVPLLGGILRIEAAAYHETRLRERPGGFGPFPRQRLLAAYAHDPATFVRAESLRAALRRTAEAALEQVDILSTPTLPRGAQPLGVPSTTRYTAPFNLLGWPAVTVPVGLTSERLPLGLQLISRPWTESLLLRAARVVGAEGPWSTVTRTP